MRGRPFKKGESGNPGGPPSNLERGDCTIRLGASVIYNADHESIIGFPAC